MNVFILFMVYMVGYFFYFLLFKVKANRIQFLINFFIRSLIESVVNIPLVSVGVFIIFTSVSFANNSDVDFSTAFMFSVYVGAAFGVLAAIGNAGTSLGLKWGAPLDSILKKSKTIKRPDPRLEIINQPEYEKHPWLFAMAIFSFSGGIIILFIGISSIGSSILSSSLIVASLAALSGVAYALKKSDYFRKWGQITGNRKKTMLVALTAGLIGYLIILGTGLFRSVTETSTGSIIGQLFCAIPTPIVVGLIFLLRPFGARP